MAEHRLEISSIQIERMNKLMAEFFENKDDSKIHEIFSIIDINNNGTIESSELKHAMSQISGEEVTDEEILDMIKEADTNSNGVIELNEFIAIMKKHRDED
jgi:calmodulin